MTSALLALWLAAAPTSGTTARPKLAVFEITVAGGIDAAVSAPMTDAVTNEIAARGFFDVLSSRDVATMLGQQRQRQLLGCSEEGSCLTELAGAIGARFVLTGALAKLGDTYQMTLQALDTQKGQPLGRSTRLAKDLAALRAQLPWALAEATGTPSPPPPSHLRSYALIGGGAALVLSGAVLGLAANTEAASTQTRLDQATRLALTAAQVQSDANRLQLEVIGAIAAASVGVAAIAFGLYTNPSDSSGGVQSASLVPLPNGLAVAGVW